MSNIDNDNLEDEAQALSDAIDSMPDSNDENEEDDSEDMSNVLLQEPKKKKPVLRMIAGIGGALVVALGGLFVYSQYMTPAQVPVSPMPRKMPPLEPAPLQAAPDTAALPSQTVPLEGDQKPSIDTPNLPDTAKLEPTGATNAASAADPFATPKVDAPAWPEPKKPELAVTKITADSLKEEAPAEPAPVVKAPKKAKVAPTFDDTADTAEIKKPATKAKVKKVVKKSANIKQSEKAVVTLKNQQPVDNGYNELF